MSSSKAASTDESTILRRMCVSIPGINMKLSEYSELIATEVDTKGSNPCIGSNGDVAAPAPVRAKVFSRYALSQLSQSEALQITSFESRQETYVH